MCLQARDAKCREDFAAELGRLLSSAASSAVRAAPLPSLAPDTDTAASSRRRRFSRSASLESRATAAAARSRSLDTEDTAAAASTDPAPQYRVLADYAPAAPGAGRQLQLCEGALVRLVKIGCAGWWFVRAQDGGEGWAPSTYLQLLPNTKTLDRK